MQQQPAPESVSASSHRASSHRANQAQVEELRRRIETLESLDESEFGEFTRRDWVICTLGSLIFPALLLLWVGR